MKTQTNTYLFKIILFIFFGTLFFSCYKKDFDKIKLANAHPEYLLPLVNADLSLKDIVDPNKKQLNITEAADGFYTFIYYQDLFEQFIVDLLKVDDVNITESISLSTGEVASLPGAGTISHDFSNTSTLNTTNGEKLKTIKIKSGNIPLILNSTFKHDIQIEITFPYIKKNGNVLVQTVTMLYQGSVPLQSTTAIDLSGYTVDCSENNTQVNSLSYTGKLRVTYKSGNAVSTAQKIDLTTGLNSIMYSYVDGYIGKYDLVVPEDSVGIDIFDNAYLGSIFFTDPKVRTIITNSIGAPAIVNINKLTTQSKISGTTDITGSIINTDIPIMYPSLAEVGQSKSTTIQLDKTNSNVQTVFNPAPNKVIYQLSGSINPDGETDNFVTDKSSIKLRGEVEIPMEGKITKFVLLDTVKGISFPDMALGSKTVTIVSGGFNISLSNGFPMNTNIQMYFLNDQNIVVDSLFKTPHFIPSGSIDAAGKVTSPSTIFIKELFDADRYKKITTSTNALLVAQFSTANGGTTPVRIYSSYKIKANIGLDIKADVSF
ncbi:hypothetical protein [uncultured Cytophaga sp.]|uniref:hypothetical protein n=1 Tax=uncultured Cytophaga sp. TaxID=160238 RepID=UPI00262A0586|nr:hypothetical protein [uncultured Cytophaga sp.]